MDELLENGKYGMIVQDDDMELENGIASLLNDKDALNRLTQVAITRSAFFETKQIVLENEALFDSCLN